MTDTIEQKALALVNEQFGSGYQMPVLGDASKHDLLWGLLRAIEQHEAFRQEVSDAMKLLSEEHEAFRQEVSDAVEAFQRIAPLSAAGGVSRHLSRFIIAKPVDPLVEALREYEDHADVSEADARWLRAAIEKRGGKIVWGEG